MSAHIAAHEVFVQLGNDGFWKYHDLLFNNQQQLDRDNLIKLAEQVGADGAKVGAAIDNEKHKATIEQDVAIANDAGITGTPAFVVNAGWRVKGAQGFRVFKRTIEYALKHP